MGPHQLNTVDVSTLIFVFWQKISVLKGLYAMVHCHEAKFTFLAKDLAFSINVLL
jgi:hypothetical protein